MGNGSVAEIAKWNGIFYNLVTNPFKYLLLIKNVQNVFSSYLWVDTIYVKGNLTTFFSIWWCTRQMWILV